MIRFAAMVFFGPLLALAGSPSAHAEDQVWQGKNGWEIVYTKIPGGSSDRECALNWDPDNTDHRLFWTWDGIMLMVGFMGPAPVGSEHGQMPEPSSLDLSVDGRTLKRGLTYGFVSKALPNYGQMIFVEPMHMAWDHNNLGHDTGLETEAVFNILRHGHNLKVQIYGQTYIEDLKGVGSALDLFGQCIKFMEDRL
jgi:hypothetical protein